MLFSTVLPLLAALPSLTLAFSDKSAHELSRSRARAHYGKKSRSEIDSELSLQKRASYRMTFYDVGLGACGGYNVASDYIVALNSAQMGGGYPAAPCGKSITISYNGKTAVAQVQDECPTCSYGELDLSRGLFDHFASESEGVFYGDWWFNDGSGSTPTTTSTYVAPTSTYVAPTTTYTPPTSTYTPPTSTYVAPTTTSTSTSSSSVYTSSTASSVIASSSAAASSSSIANSTIVPDTVISQNTTSTESSQPAGNLILLNQIVAYYGHIVVVGASR